MINNNLHPYVPIKPNHSTFAGLYVGNLGENVSTDMLYSFFHSYTIININHPFDKFQNKHKNYAFVYFQNHECAERCLKEKNYQKILVKPIRLMPILDISILKKEANVFVKNIDPSLTAK